MFRILGVVLLLTGLSSTAAPPPGPRTFANPINIDYRFMTEPPSRREAADPVILVYGGEYYLFASKSGGYWHSTDMADWTFIKPEGLPIEAYAPAVMVLGDTLYYTACNIGLYRTQDPISGKWELVGQPFNVGDPDLFADDDGRVYLYYGLSYNGAISGMELDPKNGFRPIGEPFVCFRADYLDHGWERRGEDNLGASTNGVFQEGPWLEGSWMTKHEETYYLQYAAPGTEYKTYADGVYTSKSPRGPFVYAPNSPFSHKPTGFIGGAGHSATFRDKQGRYWHVATMVVSVKHQFERRLGIFPVEFDAQGVMHADTLLGDYPQMLPALRKESGTNLTGWMLLSYGKKASASSSLDGFGPEKAFDEDIKTYWSARTADSREWLKIDMGNPVRIHAVQVNFAEHESTAMGRSPEIYQQYALEGSLDDTNWTLLVDRGANRKDAPHDYTELDHPADLRYLRLKNIRTAGGGPFSIRDLRVFGTGAGKPPQKAPEFRVQRDSTDPRNAAVRWEIAPGAEGYVVRYGMAPGKLYQNYEVRGQKEIVIHGLNAGVDYYFTVDAFNDCGRTPGTNVKQ
jgi:xylan 1,4-beta-xylosidase